MLLDVHRTFIKTGKMINIAKFQKVEFFFVCVIRLHVYTYFSIIFHYKLLQDINYSSLSIHVLLKPDLEDFDH